MRKQKKIVLFVCAIIALCLFIIYIYRHFYFESKTKHDTIKVGILHSLTGTLAISELPVIDATLLAIDEINKQGGVSGRLIEPVIKDGGSDPEKFASLAEELISKEKVSVIFGCWTSASRKSVKNVVEKHNSLLFYPVQYEGLELSPNIIYTGSTSNQQIIPGVKWAFDNLGKKFFLVGSDYIFPHAANEIIKDQMGSLGGEVVGEEYVLLGNHDFSSIVQKIALAKPDVILNTINGDSNIPFFKELRNAGISPEKIPTMSFSVGETEMNLSGAEDMSGNYAVWSYFESIQSSANQTFIKKIKKRYGIDRRISDPMEAAYFGVHLWAQAVSSVDIASIDNVRIALKNQVFNAPEGIIYIDSSNQHTWKFVRIGKIQPDKQFAVLWNSSQPVPPTPYPIYFRDIYSWNNFLNNLYVQWGNKWANPP